MALIGQEHVKSYLNDLGQRLKNVNGDLAGIIDSEAEYLSIKSKNGMFSELLVGTSGFPSAPSLKADIKNIYEASKKYDRKAKGIVEKLKKGDVNNNDKFDLKIGTIYVPTDVLEGFIKPTIQPVNDDYSLFSIRTIEEKKDGWFYLTEQKKKLKKATEIENASIALIKNFDELVVGGLAGAGFIFLTPVALLAYPAWMVLKFSRNDRKKHYLLTDTFSFVKGMVKKRKKVSEKKVRADPDETHKWQFKFFHPLIDKDLTEPVLIYKTEDGELGVVGEHSDLEQEVKKSVDVNGYLIKGLGSLTATGIVPHSLAIPRLKHKTEITKVMDVLGRDVTVSNHEIYQLDKEQIDEIANIIKEDLWKGKVLKPSKVFVDKYGSLYPPLPLWMVGNQEDAKNFKAFNELFIEYLFTNERNLPLTTFAKKINVTNDVLRKLEDSPPAYVFVNKGQLTLKDPEKLYEKLDPFSEKVDNSSNIALKKRLSRRIETLTKKPQFKNLFEKISIIELESQNYHGCLKGLHELNRNIVENITDLEKNVRSHKYSQAQIQRKTNKITELQNNLIQEYGKLSPEAISDMDEELTRGSSEDRTFILGLKDKLRKSNEGVK